MRSLVQKDPDLTDAQMPSVSCPPVRNTSPTRFTPVFCEIDCLPRCGTRELLPFSPSRCPSFAQFPASARIYPRPLRTVNFVDQFCRCNEHYLRIQYPTSKPSSA